MGSPAARGGRAPPGSDGASPYRLELRSSLGAIVLVVVVVLVLDLLSSLDEEDNRGLTRSARVGRAPPGSDGASPYRLELRSMPWSNRPRRRRRSRSRFALVLLVASSPSRMRKIGGLTRQRAGDARRPVRTEPRPTALSFALALEQSSSSSSSFSFSICSAC